MHQCGLGVSRTASPTEQPPPPPPPHAAPSPCLRSQYAACRYRPADFHRAARCLPSWADSTSRREPRAHELLDPCRRLHLPLPVSFPLLPSPSACPNLSPVGSEKISLVWHTDPLGSQSWSLPPPLGLSLPRTISVRYIKRHVQGADMWLQSYSSHGIDGPRRRSRILQSERSRVGAAEQIKSARRIRRSPVTSNINEKCHRCHYFSKSVA